MVLSLKPLSVPCDNVLMAEPNPFPTTACGIKLFGSLENLLKNNDLLIFLNISV